MKLLIRVLGDVGAVMVEFVVTLALIDYFGAPQEK
jgi:hypothetical protein